MLSGFAEDYHRIIMNVKQKVFFCRSSTTDNDATVAPATTTNENLKVYFITIQRP